MATTSDYKLGSFQFPRGWFAVARVDDIGDGPLAVRAFGEDWIVYRTEDGGYVTMEAYCPHMGAHLASGQIGATGRRGVQIVGDTIRCPLHGWRFGPDGRCKEIAYSSVQLPRGRLLKTLTSRSYAGLVLAWHDPEDMAPDFEPAPFPEWTDPAFLTTGTISLGQWPLHQTENVEHHGDKIHSVNVHGHDGVKTYLTRFEDHRMGMDATFLDRKDDGTWRESRSVSDYRGPGFMLVRTSGERDVVAFAAHSPIEDGAVVVWYGAAFRASEGGATEADRAFLDQLRIFVHQSFLEDYEILARKKPSLRLVEVPGDGPFRKLRTWYSQFYNPRSEAGRIQSKVNGIHDTQGDVPPPWAQEAA